MEKTDSRPIVCKFGGTSSANAECFRRIKAILDSDPVRRYVVVSAPAGVTNLLHACHKRSSQEESWDSEFRQIKKIFLEIASDLGLDLEELKRLLDQLEDLIKHGATLAEIARWGEFLNARLLAEFLGWPFIDSYSLVHFNDDGQVDHERTYLDAERMSMMNQTAVISGYYGSDPAGQIKLLPRGGSDTTGALVAHGVKAGLYENWTDVAGVSVLDPKLGPSPIIGKIPYDSAGEMFYRGAKVLHPDAIKPVRDANIRLRICSSLQPDEPGTIVEEEDPTSHDSGIIAITGKKHFLILSIHKDGLHQETGIVRRVLSVLEDNGLSWDHLGTGIDRFSIGLPDEIVANGLLAKVVMEIKTSTGADHLTQRSNVSFISIVGHRFAQDPWIKANIFIALAEANIATKPIGQADSDLSLTIGVNDGDYDEAIRAIFQKLFPKKQ